MSGICQVFEQEELLPQQQLRSGRDVCSTPKKSNEFVLE